MRIVVIVFVHYRIAPSGPHSRFDLSTIGIREIIVSRSPHSMELFGRDKHVSRVGLLVNQFQELPGMSYRRRFAIRQAVAVSWESTFFRYFVLPSHPLILIEVHTPDNPATAIHDPLQRGVAPALWQRSPGKANGHRPGARVHYPPSRPILCGLSRPPRRRLLHHADFLLRQTVKVIDYSVDLSVRSGNLALEHIPRLLVVRRAQRFVQAEHSLDQGYHPGVPGLVRPVAKINRETATGRGIAGSPTAIPRETACTDQREVPSQKPRVQQTQESTRASAFRIAS